MNQNAPDTSRTGATLVPDWIGAFTTVHLIWIGVLGLLAIAVIVWGARLAARRKAAERGLKRHNAEIAAESRAPSPRTSQPDAPAFPAPVSVAAPPPPAALADGDAIASGPANGPVTQLKGLGPKLTARLAELGITTVGQMAALTDDDAAALDAQLGAFAGRMTRDRWLEQARFLAAGDVKGFEAVFGRL